MFRDEALHHRTTERALERLNLLLTKIMMVVVRCTVNKYMYNSYTESQR